MLGTLWQWLKQLFQKIQALFVSQTASHSPAPVSSTQTESTTPPLTDTDYEFLFSQLIEGVMTGWDGERILRFFQVMGERGALDQWVSWLQRFGEKLVASPAPNYELAQRLIFLSDRMRSQPSLQEMGSVAYNIGAQLLTRETSGAIWEYDGPDLYSTTGQVPQLAMENKLEALSLDVLAQRLQEDPELLENLAAQLGVTSQDPQEILQILQAQLEANVGKIAEDPPQEAPAIDAPAATDPESLANQGLEYAKGGNYEAAIEIWDQALGQKRDYPQVWYNRGLALVNLGRWQEAVFSYDQALGLRQDDHLAWNNRGEALRNLGQLPEAIESYDQAISLKPNFYNAWYNRGLALKSLERLEDAISSWDRALAIKPDLVDAWKNRGNALRDLERLDEAEESWQKAREIN